MSTKTTITKRLLRYVAIVLLLVILGGCIYLNGLLPIITGYAAKNLASAVFVSHREAKDVEALDLNFSFIRFASNKVDFENKTVTSRFLWGKSTAAYREDYGVTLLRGTTADKLREQRFPSGVLNETQVPLPVGDSAITESLAPIAKAFVSERAYHGHPFAFMVLHKGGVVAEAYDEGIGPDTKLLSWSMAKSFANALVGMMVKDSLLDIHAPMDIPEWQGDGRKAITLHDLMQMQSGLAWNEDYGARSDVNIMLHSERDMGLFALSKPLEYEPGTHWLYSSGSTNIVMRYLRSRFPSDEAFLRYMHSRLFAPLGIVGPVFEQDMSGTPVASSYLYATAKDFARFGQMYLDDGCVGSERILPQGWVDYTRASASDSSDHYGALFWLNGNGKFPDVPRDMYYCDGHDGQDIFIFPSHEVVVVILGYSPKPDNLIDFNALLSDILSITSR
ncbi:MAG: serine hydrolase [Bacteroidaceae bacterium]|nr:serine hydrolase [Bacteroidaceae bacterium]